MENHLRRRRFVLFLTLLMLAGFPPAPEAAEQAISLKPEKSRLEIAIAAAGSTSLPTLVTQEAGYFAKHGLDVTINTVSASAAVQGVLSGRIDIYQGGAAAIAAHLAGADIIYVAAAVDRSSLNLFGQKGITSFEGLRGKSVATTSPGAFGEIAVRMSGRKHGMEIGKEIKLVYHRSPGEALATFLVGNADGLVITPPQTEMAKQQGYPGIIDYYREGLKITGPGTSVTREFSQKYPNTIKAFLMAYLDGLKRCIDDEDYAMKIQAKYTKVSNPKSLAETYQQGLRVWNKDMRVIPRRFGSCWRILRSRRLKALTPKDFLTTPLLRLSTASMGPNCFPVR